MDERGTLHSDDAIETIFHKATELGSEAERAVYLDRACASNPELRAKVEKLLEAQARAGGFMRDPTPAPAMEKPGARIGPYKLLQVIGEGGMGAVYMADQTHPVKRRVALKIVKPGMDTGEIVARFEAERQALALMDHPSIAKVFDAGTTESGRPYFVMELVKGIPIAAYCDEHELEPRRRLELFVHVCRAVHHAHQKGIIHRDLKPANVLVADYDDKPVPKVIDFGVAKATGQKLTEKTMFTQFGQIIGTFEYMSPEQAKLNQLDVDTRSDIYSLGVLLYELLTGTTPFERGRLQLVGFEEILRIIREEEPPKPSTRISSLGDRTAAVTASRSRDPRQLRRDLSGELDWIVMRAMDKDRNRRYESAASMADDIERFLRDEAVHACPPSTAYRVRKFVRRHRRPVIAAAALMLVMILGLAGTSYGFIEATRAEEKAVRVNFRMAFNRGLTLCDDGHVAHGMLWLARALELCPDDAPAMERVVRANLNAWRRELNVLEAMFPHEAAVISVAISPDGERLVTGSDDRTAQYWDTRTGAAIGSPLKHRGDVHELAFSTDGKRLLSADYGTTAYIWDVESGARIHTLPHGNTPREAVVVSHAGGVLGAAFRPPDNAQLVTCCGDGTIRIWDARSGKEEDRLANPTKHMVHDVVVSADGKWILTSSHDKTVRLWDFDSRELLATFKLDTRAVTADFRGDGQIVTGDAGGLMFLWSVEAALADADRTLEVAAEEFLAGPWRQRGAIHRLRVSPDGTRFLSASLDTTAQLWDPDQDAAVGAAFEHEAAVWAVAFAPDGARVATACDDNVARLWRPARGQRVRVVEHEVPGDHEAVCSPDGGYVLMKPDEETAVVRDAATKAELCTLPFAGGIRAFAVSPDRSRVLVGGAEGTCLLWDVGKRVPVKDFGHGSGVWDVAINSQGTHALTGGFDGIVQLRDARSGELVREVPVGLRVQGVAFGPGQQFVYGCSDKSAHLYASYTASKPIVLRGHLSAVFSPSFSADGRRVATGSHDNTVRVWDTATGMPVSAPMRHPGPINYSVGTALSPDGSLAAGASEDGSARVWDVATARPIGPVLRHETRVRLVAFTSDTQIRTGTPTGAVRTWDPECSPLPGDVERIKAWVQVITGFELMDDDGALRALDGPRWRERRIRLVELGGPPAN